ncbi:MAG: pyridoxamine 5'-phosphate oxidase family protein [Chloroflexi bacterium]|nr:pyridoxamine 5'-phosphate oxidase family protein [Chloroflexota bacterium]
MRRGNVVGCLRPYGAPHIVPIWFWWDGDAILVFSKPDAQKFRNLRDRPQAMLALGDAEDDFDVGRPPARRPVARSRRPLSPGASSSQPRSRAPRSVRSGR